MKNTTHIILQGKGGVGKSLISSMVAQYLIERGFSPNCADTDPVNSTFNQIKGLNVELVPIVESGAVVQKLFDPLFETILETSDPSVIDTGSSTFMPIIKYMKANNIFNVLENSGKKIFMHSVITAGASKDDTANGLIQLLDWVDGTKTKIVVWQNEFWGIPMFDGTTLDEMSWITENKNKIAGIVKIIDRNNDAFTADMKNMGEKHLTIAEVKSSDEFKFFSKSRISSVFNDVFDELDLIFSKKSGVKNV